MKEKENMKEKISLTLVSVDPITHRLVRRMFLDVESYTVSFNSDSSILIFVRVCHYDDSDKLSDVTTTLRFDSMPDIHVLSYVEDC